MDRNTARSIRKLGKRKEEAATQGAGTTGGVCPDCRKRGKTENIRKSGKRKEAATQGAGTTRRCRVCGRPM